LLKSVARFSVRLNIIRGLSSWLFSTRFLHIPCNDLVIVRSKRKGRYTYSSHVSKANPCQLRSHVLYRAFSKVYLTGFQL
jgi:hypothetical protein